MDQSTLIEKNIQTCINQFEFIPDEEVINDLKRALLYRLEEKSPEAVRNTYLKDLEIPQIILFDILANRFPLVLSAQQIVTNAILQAVKGKKHITVLDLGIGRGVQAKRIISALNDVEGLQSMTLIGVEIMEDALNFTTEQLRNLKSSLDIDFNFIPIHNSVEEISVDTIKANIPLSNECMLVNASLTLHHIQTDALRSEVFNKIALLKPSLVTLIEPNTNCHTNNFEERLKNVYEHFAALYMFINTLHLLPEEKKGLKQFFSTELFDAVALPDEHRFERYAPSEDWLKTGIEAGLSPLNISTCARKIHIDHINIETSSSGIINFKYQNSDILGIISLQT